MTDSSPRMQWPYPAENADPWLDDFRAFIAALDASGFASREDRNLLIMGGGTISWNGTTGVLTWTAAIEFLSPNTGFLNQIPAGNVTLTDGQIVRGNLARALGGNASMAVAAAGFALSNDNSIVVCIRRGTNLYWRNGLVMADGDEVVNIGSTQGGGTTNSFVFRPGGTETGNVYADWEALYAAASAVEGPVVVSIEDELGSAQISAGTYDFTDWTIVGRYKPVTGLRPNLTILNGVTISGNFRLERVVLELDIGASTPITINSNQRFIELVDADLNGNGGNGLIFGTLGPARIVMRGRSEAYNGAFLLLGAVVQFDLYDRSVLNGDACSGSGAALTVRAIDNETVVIEPQGGYAGTLNVETPYEVMNGPLDASQLGATELHIGSVYLRQGMRILASSNAMLGGAIVSDTGNLRMRRFTGGTPVALWTTVGTLANTLLGTSVLIGDDDWYDLYLFSGGASQTAVVKGLRLLITNDP